MTNAMQPIHNAVSRSSSCSSSQHTSYWLNHFLSLRDYELLCAVDEDYIGDRFNLTGLQSEVENYQQAYSIITDKWEEDEEDEAMRQELEIAARHLYGLIHQRFIITTRGLQKMLEKYERADFGLCPRSLCNGASVLPVGLFDISGQATVKMYCPHCEDIYNPTSTRHAQLDGAYWGTSFPHILFQAFPSAAPERKNSTPIFPVNNPETARSDSGTNGAVARRGSATQPLPSSFTIDRYVPRIFGFRVHENAKWMRKQLEVQRRLIEERHRFISVRSTCTTTPITSNNVEGSTAIADVLPDQNDSNKSTSAMSIVTDIV